MALEKFRTKVFVTSRLTVGGLSGSIGELIINGNLKGTFVLQGTLTSTSTIDATSGAVVLPYGTSAPTLATNGMISVASVGGTARLVIKAGGSTYTMAFGTAVSGGTITLTSA